MQTKWLLSMAVYQLILPGYKGENYTRTGGGHSLAGPIDVNVVHVALAQLMQDCLQLGGILPNKSILLTMPIQYQRRVYELFLCI
jgi:hypothetical protein